MYENLKWKKTSQDRYIALYSSSENLSFENEKPFLIIGGVHGDEPEGVFLVESFIEWAKEVYRKGHILKPWIAIPCLNPDGFSKNERVNGNGVDLNRNFPSKDWSNEFHQPRYYPGQNPASEIETQCVIELIEKFQPHTIIHCHSWKPLVVYTGSQAREVATAFANSSGYPLQEDIGYPTPGSLGQYGYLMHNTGVVCTEEREGATQEETWERFGKAFEVILGNSSV